MTSQLDVRLDDIPTCFEGIIPAAIATVAEDGTPNVTYLSIVHRVDDDRVALSRQFFNKTDHNTVVNPNAQVGLFEPETGRSFLLDLTYERTDHEGALFERMRTHLDAVAAYAGMTNVFNLKGIDICRVVSCRMLPAVSSEGPSRREVKIERVEEFSRRLADVEDMDDLLATVLGACSELLGYPHAFVMLADETGERLYTVASTGFDASGAGSEVLIGEGLIGIAAARRQSVRVTHMGRDVSYSQAVRSAAQLPSRIETAIALPALPSIQSQLVAPMLAYRKLVGVLVLQSDVPGAFQAVDECVVGILASQVAMAMATLDRLQPSTERQAAETQPIEVQRAAQVKHYAEDDSVFLDNESLFKGVAGAILWRLLQDHEREGRADFSNKELRLDPTLQLPDIKDNLEARLILLRRRLEERCDYLRIARTARGRFRLDVSLPLVLVEPRGE